MMRSKSETMDNKDLNNKKVIWPQKNNNNKQRT